MDQIRRVAEAGADIVRVAVPREQDVEALKTIVAESPIPVIADIHFNHTLAIKAIDAGAHCVRINPGNIGGPGQGRRGRREGARAAGTPLRIGVNSGSLPKHLRELEFANPVEALVTAAVEFVELMERLDFTDFKVSMKSTSVPNTIASNRLLSRADPVPAAPRGHRGRDEVVGLAEVAPSASARCSPTASATRSGSRLSTFHAEEEVKVAWEILKALKLRERGPVLIACPTCGRLQFDMDSVVAEVERRLEAYDDPIEVSVLGCAVNGIGEARHADFGITGAKDMGMIYSKGEPLKKVADRAARRRALHRDRPLLRRRQEGRARRGAGRRGRASGSPSEEDATAMTPERLAALEAAAGRRGRAAPTPARSTRRSRRSRGGASAGRRAAFGSSRWARRSRAPLRRCGRRYAGGRLGEGSRPRGPGAWLGSRPRDDFSPHSGDFSSCGRRSTPPPPAPIPLSLRRAVRPGHDEQRRPERDARTRPKRRPRPYRTATRPARDRDMPRDRHDRRRPRHHREDRDRRLQRRQRRHEPDADRRDRDAQVDAHEERGRDLAAAVGRGDGVEVRLRAQERHPVADAAQQRGREDERQRVGGERGDERDQPDDHEDEADRLVARGRDAAAHHDLRGARREQHRRRDRALEREVRRVEQRPGVGGDDGQVEAGDRPRGGRGQGEPGERGADLGRDVGALQPPPAARPGGHPRDRSTPASTTPVTTSPTTKLVVRGAGAHSASAPPISGPAALPPACASVDTSAARATAPAGASSTSAAVAAPLAAPTARPCTARAANSHAVVAASANSARPTIATARPPATTGRRPIRSDSWPKTISDGHSTSW